MKVIRSFVLQAMKVEIIRKVVFGTQFLKFLIRKKNVGCFLLTNFFFGSDAFQLHAKVINI